MKTIRTYLFILAVLACAACKTTKILPDEPVIGNIPQRPEKLNSQVTLPFEIDISTIEAFINQKLPSGQIESGSGRQGNTTRFSYQVFRNKPARFSAQGNELIFRVPIDVRARGSYTACAGFWRDGDCCTTPNPFGSGCATPGVTVTEHGDAAPTVDVELRIKLAMQEDYSLQANTYLKGTLIGDTYLHIDLIGDLIRINIDIKDKLEKPLQKFVQDFQQDINQKVAELVQQYDIRSEAEKYWAEIKEPIPLDDFWLDIQPQKVLFENLNANNGKLRMALGISAILQVVTARPTVPDLPLPNLTLNENTQGKFNIYLPATTNYDYLESLVEEEVLGKKYEKDGVSVIIKDVNIQGIRLNNNGALLIKANIKGKAKFKRFKGDLYFTAIPSIDHTNKVVSIEDFQIEANTSSFLINNGLPYLVDNFYYDEIKAQLKYSYAEEFEKYFSLINENIKQLEIDNLIVSGELQKISVPGLYIDREELELLLIAEGVLRSRIQIDQKIGIK